VRLSEDKNEKGEEGIRGLERGRVCVTLKTVVIGGDFRGLRSLHQS